MTKNELNLAIFSVLSSLKHAGGMGVPEGHLYAALMTQWSEINLSWWRKFVDLLLVSQLVKQGAASLLYITDKGKSFVSEVEAV